MLRPAAPPHCLLQDLDLKDNSVLRGCDPATARSLNGCRVTDTVLEVGRWDRRAGSLAFGPPASHPQHLPPTRLQLVPNKESFHLALKFIKEWATRRGVYSNVSGYFGGINWAICTAYICQLYPTGAPATVLSRRAGNGQGEEGRDRSGELHLPCLPALPALPCPACSALPALPGDLDEQHPPLCWLQVLPCNAYLPLALPTHAGGDRGGRHGPAGLGLCPAPPVHHQPVSRHLNSRGEKGPGLAATKPKSGSLSLLLSSPPASINQTYP